MLQSIIDGYKMNEFRDPDFKREKFSVGEIVGESIYLYFKPIGDVSRFAGPIVKASVRGTYKKVRRLFKK